MQRRRIEFKSSTLNNLPFLEIQIAILHFYLDLGLDREPIIGIQCCLYSNLLDIIFFLVIPEPLPIRRS